MQTHTLKLTIPSDDSMDSLSLNPPEGLRFAEGVTPPQLFISLARAGNMAYKERNRRADRGAFFMRKQMEGAGIYYCQQKHTRKVVVVHRGAPVEDYIRQEADGLICPPPRAGEQEICLCVTVADCLPVFLLDRESGACGVVHSGWKGTGIAAVALRLMVRKLGCRPENITAIIGPGIGCCCYAVAPGRFGQFCSRFGAQAGEQRAGRYFLDLRRANSKLLEDEGTGELFIIENCTACGEGFHSYRRDGAEAFGLMLACLRRPAFK